MKGNGIIMGDFSRFQLLQEHLFFLISTFVHILTGAQRKQMEQVKVTVRVGKILALTEMHGREGFM